MAEIISSATTNVKKHGNEEIESPCKGNEFKRLSPLKSQIINENVSMKVESMHGTPNKVGNPTSFNSRSENANSPQKNMYLFNQKDWVKSPLSKSPGCKRWNKSVDTNQLDVCPRTKTISINSDCDTFKLELYGTENCNFDSIDLLHDLDSVVKFENSKDILYSMMNVCTMQEDDSLLGMNEDPATDPLSISDCEKKEEKKDPDTSMDLDLKFSQKRRIRIESESEVKRKDKHYFKKCKLETEEEHLSKKLENFEEVSLVDIKVSFDHYIFCFI